MARANVNTCRQSCPCMQTQERIHRPTQTQNEKTLALPITHPPTKQRSQTQSVFAVRTASLHKVRDDRFTIAGCDCALDCPCPFSSATQRQLSPCLSLERTPLIQSRPTPGIATTSRLIVISTRTGGSLHLLLDVS